MIGTRIVELGAFSAKVEVGISCTIFPRLLLFYMGCLGRVLLCMLV